MAFIPVADTVQVELFMSLYTQKIENTLYFRLTGGFGLPEVTDLWNKLLSWWTTDYAAIMSMDLSLRGAKFTDLSTSTGFTYEPSAPTPNPDGAINSGGLPGNVAMCVSFKTLSRGRSYRGRNFVSGFPETVVVGNTFDASAVTAIQSAYAAILSLPFTDPWEWVVVSRETAGAPRVTGVATPVVTAVVLDNLVDSQRRRLTGRGQ